MVRKIGWMVLAVWLLAGPAFALFTPPTKDQLKAAARAPSLIVALLQDANAMQAAEVATDIIVQIVDLDLEDEERDLRIADLTANLFHAWPQDQWLTLAAALGRFVAASPTASMNAATVSATQTGIIKAADVKIGDAFGNAYNLAMQTVAGAPGGGKTVPPQPPPPPVALPYEGQRFR